MPILFAPPRAPEGPQAPKTINFKRTATMWLVLAFLACVSDLHVQATDLREAQELAAKAGEDDVTMMFGMQTRECVSAHCREGRHIFRETDPAAGVKYDETWAEDAAPDAG